MRITPLAVCAAFALSVAGALAQSPDEGYKLLLTPQHLRRLQRDRERKTIRWMNFERRVETVPDSPQRGFELALFYVVTGDEAKGREAVEWAGANRCNRQQIPLIADWCRKFLTADDRRALSLQGCDGRSLSYRDQAFNQIAFENGSVNSVPLREDTITNALADARHLYALCEYLITVRTLTRTDLREQNTTFFRVLPKEFLLSLRPDKIEHPDWMAHIAALALVAVDPNLEGSQFLQGWAMEDSQMITEGPGVGYEFLWADPYLPGIAYRNLDPWVYDSAGRLFARTNWDPNSCWLADTPSGIDQENCPDAALERSKTFGSLTLLPMFASCLNVPARANRETLILWRLKPGEVLTYRGEENKQLFEAADAAGMWLVPENVRERVCQGRNGRR